MDKDVVCACVCVYTYIYVLTHTNTAIKKNEILQCATMWMDLEIIILNEISQRKRNTCVITYTWDLKYKTNEYI